MSKYSRHQEFLKEVKLKIQQEFPAVKIFDQDSGLFVTQQGNYIRIGQDGMADLRVLFPTPIGPVSIEVEIKTGNAGQNKAQITWEKFWKSIRGVYIVISNKRDISPQLQKMRDFDKLINKIEFNL